MEMRIWKDKTPKGDGNSCFIFAVLYHLGIWKDKTPKGDGNSCLIFSLLYHLWIWKDKTPKGDGNTGQSRPKGMCKKHLER